ncbi:hypothetical protein V1477_009932 [Vespula maculifrons]|uniref:Uncharacterized protein n=1 Tax=Vespula maculifrons TaxID=7453 RepID=A0ABD2CB67_VESMC
MQQPPRGGTWVGNTCVMSKSYEIQPVGPLMQLPPRGGTWVGSTCDIVKSISKLFFKSIMKLYMLSKIYKEIEGYVSLLPYANDRENTHAHDRSCLDMSEADGVDGGAICKRGFIHLQFAAKLEAPEAERHLGSRILE